MEFSIEQQIIFYECLQDLGKILEFNFHEVLKVFYCGKRLKYGTPNCFLVVISENKNNVYHFEINHEFGCTGSSYLEHKRNKKFGPWDHENRPFTYHYKVVSDKVYEYLKNDWMKLADTTWIYPNNMDYIPGAELDLKIMNRINNMKIFL